MMNKAERKAFHEEAERQRESVRRNEVPKYPDLKDRAHDPDQNHDLPWWKR